jgi:hypothetical protein
MGHACTACRPLEGKLVMRVFLFFFSHLRLHVAVSKRICNASWLLHAVVVFWFT